MPYTDGMATRQAVQARRDLEVTNVSLRELLADADVPTSDDVTITADGRRIDAPRSCARSSPSSNATIPPSPAHMSNSNTDDGDPTFDPDRIINTLARPTSSSSSSAVSPHDITAPPSHEGPRLPRPLRA